MGLFVKGAGGSGVHNRRRGRRSFLTRPMIGGGERVVVDASVTLIFAGWLPQDGVSAGVLSLV